MTKEEQTTIRLKKSVVYELEKMRRTHRETYSEIISNLIELSKRRGQNYEFVCDGQRAKIQELWDNEEDEAWKQA